MSINNELLLMSNKDIPFPEAQLTIHNPSIEEIGLIGEATFYRAYQFIAFSKSQLSDKDKNDLGDMSNFDIFMSIMCGNENNIKNDVNMFFTLLFPSYLFKITNNEIIFINNENSARINKDNYDIFKDIIISMFPLNEENGVTGVYNPADKRAERIANKLKKYKEKIAKIKGNEEVKIAILSRYVSILAVGLQKDINILMKYTVFQLRDEFLRYQKKVAFDISLQAKMAGAKDVEEVDNWMDNIHP